MALPPLQNLLDLLPDNTEGLIEPVDLRSIVTDLYGGVSDNSNTFIGYVRTDGAVTMIDGYEPTYTLSVATKGYVDSVLFPENFVQKTGDTMSGDLFLPLYLPTEYSQAAHKGYVDSAVTSGAQGAVTTDTTNYSLITPTPQGVKIRGLKPSQNVVLTDTGTDIMIKANVQGTGGDVRTDVNNVFDPNTVQTFDNIVANVLDLNGINVENKLYSIDSDIADLGTLISQETADRIAAINAEAAARTNAINDEAADRIQGDAVLQGQISGIISNLNDLNAFDGGERVLTDYWTLVNQDGDPLTSVSTTSTIRSFSILGYSVNMCFTTFQYPSIFSNTRFTIFFEMGSGGAALLSPLENGYTLITTPYMGQPIASFPTGQVVANELYRATSAGKNSFSININTQGANSQKVPGLSWVAIGKKL